MLTRSFLLLTFSAPLALAACSVSEPNLHDRIPHNAQSDDRAATTIQAQLKSMSLAFNTLGAMSGAVGQRLATHGDVDNQGDEFGTSKNLLTDYQGGDLHFFDAKHEHFEYDLSSGASLGLSERDSKVKVYLDGHVQDDGVHVRVVSSELKVDYSHESHIESFRLVYQTGGDTPDVREVDLSFDLQELNRLYDVLRNNQPSTFHQADGTLSMKINDDTVLIDGQNLKMSGNPYTVSFPALHFDMDRNTSDYRSLNVDGQVDKNGATVGTLKVTSGDGPDGQRKLTVDVHFDDQK